LVLVYIVLRFVRGDMFPVLLVHWTGLSHWTGFAHWTGPGVIASFALVWGFLCFGSNSGNGYGLRPWVLMACYEMRLRLTRYAG